MKWIVEQAKNGQKTLKVNNVYVYSKYNPKREVANFIMKELDSDNKKVILVGLGLGYHIEEILNQFPHIEVQCILLDDFEINLYKKYSKKNHLDSNKIKLFDGDEEFYKTAQIIIPSSFLHAIGETHPLYRYLEDIKIQQISYNLDKELLELNFKRNIKLFKPIKKNIPVQSKAALVSSGPSLNETVRWLKKHRKKFDIYCVGSALKILLKEGIIPDYIFITDAKSNIIQEINDEYKAILIFLSTANSDAVDSYRGSKQIIFQKGYSLAEKFAIVNDQPLFETGGSVATTTFSYIEWVGYKSVYLFGQDLGFSKNSTHANNSTSGREIKENEKLQKILANDKTEIFTTKNLSIYRHWFDRKCTNTNLKVYNTAKKGAVIKGTTFFDITKKINFD